MSLTLFADSIANYVPLAKGERQLIEGLPHITRSVARRREAIRRGSTPEYLYVVLEGWAGRYGLRSDGSRRLTGFLLPGDFCGIHAVCHKPMDHAILAFTKCNFALVEQKYIDALVAEAPIIGQALWNAKLRDEIRLRTWLLNSDDSLRVYAHLICELHERQRLPAEGSSAFALPLTQEDIGDALGITAVHTNRIMRKLREAGLIAHKRGILTITDISNLREVAHFNPSP